MNEKLTIIIPTYNRSEALRLLLTTLKQETEGLDSEVCVYVSDNCSTDNTSEVIASISKTWPELQHHRHNKNIGADGNFCHCVSKVTTRWFWIIGDDDLPKPEIVKRVIFTLRSEKPALLYLHSEWTKTLFSNKQGEPVETLGLQRVSANQFANRVHIWVTFISGLIVDRYRLETALGNFQIDRYKDTSLVQLGWALPLLQTTGPFLLSSEKCILATDDNTGGYGLLTVFGVNFTRIVNEQFGSGHPIAKRLINGSIRYHLPALVWSTRTAKRQSKHLTESPWKGLRDQLGSYGFYWTLILPLGRMPRTLVAPLFQAWRITIIINRRWLRLRLQ